MPAPTPKPSFDAHYQLLLQHLTLKGLQPKTIDAYSRAIRRIGQYFDHDISALTLDQLTSYFSQLLQSHSWTTVKLDLYGLKFYHQHVLQKPWVAPGLIKPPKVKRLPNIVTQTQMQQILERTRVLSYRVFFFTLYSLGLRLGEGLRLQVGDIDAQRQRVHIRDAKGNKDRLVPLPQATLELLRRFWSLHRNPGVRKASATPRREDLERLEVSSSHLGHTNNKILQYLGDPRMATSRFQMNANVQA